MCRLPLHAYESPLFKNMKDTPSTQPVWSSRGVKGHSLSSANSRKSKYLSGNRLIKSSLYAQIKNRQNSTELKSQ